MADSAGIRVSLRLCCRRAYEIETVSLATKSVVEVTVVVITVAF